MKKLLVLAVLAAPSLAMAGSGYTEAILLKINAKNHAAAIGCANYADSLADLRAAYSDLIEFEAFFRDSYTGEVPLIAQKRLHVFLKTQQYSTEMSLNCVVPELIAEAFITDTKDKP